jgi:hypothetical protein
MSSVLNHAPICLRALGRAIVPVVLAGSRHTLVAALSRDVPKTVRPFFLEQGASVFPGIAVRWKKLGARRASSLDREHAADAMARL